VTLLHQETIESSSPSPSRHHNQKAIFSVASQSEMVLLNNMSNRFVHKQLRSTKKCFALTHQILRFDSGWQKHARYTRICNTDTPLAPAGE
jgi:hypothetical protein